MAAGAREPVVSLVDRTLAGAPVGNGASLIPGGERRRVADAALAPRLTIDNVDIEIVVAESGIFGAGREPNLQFGLGGEKLSEARRQPLRRETWRAVQPKQLWAASGNFFHASPQIVERSAGMTHEVLTGGRQPDRSGAPFKERRAHRAFKLADCVADGTRRQMEFACSITKRAGARGRFEGTDRRDRNAGEQHLMSEPDSSIQDNCAFVGAQASA